MDLAWRWGISLNISTICKIYVSVTRTVSNKVYLASSERLNSTWNRKCKDINSFNIVCLKIRRTVDNVFNYLADEYNKYCLQWFLGIKNSNVTLLCTHYIYYAACTLQIFKCNSLHQVVFVNCNLFSYIYLLHKCVMKRGKLYLSYDDFRPNTSC